MATVEVLAQLGVVVAQAAEVHDAFDTGVLRGGAEVLGERGVLRRHPVGTLADAVHEEHGDVDVGHRLGEVATDVGADHLDLVGASSRRRACALACSTQPPRHSSRRATIISSRRLPRFEYS